MKTGNLIDWNTLPKAHAVELVNRQLLTSARFWILGVEDKADRLAFNNFCASVREAGSGLYKGGYTRSGAWEESKPWARHIEVLGLKMLEIDGEERAKLGDDFNKKLLGDWEKSLGLISKHVAQFAGEGRWMLQEQRRSDWESSLFTSENQKQCGLAMNTMDEAALLAKSIATPGQRPRVRKAI